jgi:hypothetical protein
MKNTNYGLFAVAVALVAVGALWLGLPVSTLGLLAIVLLCPLMMLFMMKGMHSGDSHGQSGSKPRDREHNGTNR